jgi:cytochrome P450 family 6
MFDTYLLQLSVVSAIVLTAIYVYFRVSFSYWTKRGVPTLNPTPPFGDISDAIFTKNNFQRVVNDFYKDFDGQKFGGIYNFAVPLLLLRDPEIIKNVLVKDFDKFHSRGVLINEEKEPLQGHLFALSGSKWRNLRVKLSPTFTSGKMKMMFGTLVDCGQELQQCLKPLASKGETIEIKDVLARFSTDIIASCAFGIQCNCLQNPDADFRNWGRKIFEPTLKKRFIRTVELALPSLSRLFGLRIAPDDISNYFLNMVKKTVEYREKNGVKRNDFMELMLQLKNKTLGVAEGEDMTLQNLDIDDLKTNTPFGKSNHCIINF